MLFFVSHLKWSKLNKTILRKKNQQKAKKNILIVKWMAT